MLRRSIAPVLLAGAIVACVGSSPGRGSTSSAAGGGPEATLPQKSIDEVLAAHTDLLMALPGVVGTAIGLCEGERCIKVFLSEANATTRRQIPERIEGYRVGVEVTGPIRPR